MFNWMFEGCFRLTLGLAAWCVWAARPLRPHSDKSPANKQSECFQKTAESHKRKWPNKKNKKLGWVAFSGNVLSNMATNTVSQHEHKHFPQLWIEVAGVETLNQLLHVLLLIKLNGQNSINAKVRHRPAHIDSHRLSLQLNKAFEWLNGSVSWISLGLCNCLWFDLFYWILCVKLHKNKESSWEVLTGRWLPEVNIKAHWTAALLKKKQECHSLAGFSSWLRFQNLWLLQEGGWVKAAEG